MNVIVEQRVINRRRSGRIDKLGNEEVEEVNNKLGIEEVEEVYNKLGNEEVEEVEEVTK